MLYLKSWCLALKVRLSVFILIFFTCTSTVYAQMRELYRTGAYEDITSYSFATPAEGYVTFHSDADGNRLVYTSDSGHTFTRIPLSENNIDQGIFSVDLSVTISPMSVVTLSANEILLVAFIGERRFVLSSVNKGATFKLVYASTPYGDISLKHLSGTDTVIGMVGLTTLSSSDRGQTWTYGISFGSARRGILTAFNDTCMFVVNIDDTLELLKTMDGKTYKKMPVPAEWSRVQFSMVSPSKGWAFAFSTGNNGYRGNLYSTVDSGYTWNKVENKGEPIDSLYNITMINDTLGFGTGVNSKLYKSTDGGATWLRLPRTSSFSSSSMDYQADFKTIGNDYVWVARRVMLEMSSNGGGPAMRECTALSFSPVKARIGDPILIKGDNFSMVDSVTLGGTMAASWQVVDKNTLRVIAGSGSSGDIVVYTPVNTVSLKGYSAVPTFSDLFPKSGTTNTHLTLEGTSFTSVTQVKVGNAPARAFRILSNEKIELSIPYTSNGAIQIISPDTVITTNLFYYYQGPAISLVSPLAGPAGTTVTITGANFNTTPDSNVVYFGGIKGKVISSTPTEIKVTVPQGAPYGNISVRTRLLTASSSYAFSLTFPNGGSINPTSFSAPSGFDAGGHLTRPGKTTLADFDGDGKPDLITLDRGANNVVISRNDSKNGVISFADHLKIAVGSPTPDGLFKAVPADINGDGKIDLCIGNRTEGNTYIYLNTSTPGNISFDAIPVIPGILLDVADMNQDGRLDLIQQIGYDGVIRTNYSEPDSISFENYTITVRPFGVPVSWNAFATTLYGRALPTLIFADIKGEYADISANYSLPDSLIFATRYDFAVLPGELVTGDYNNDGLFDFGISDWVNTLIFSSTQGQNGAVGELTAKALSDLSGICQVALQDMDGDGKADGLIGVKGVKKLYLYHNTFGEGGNEFASVSVLKLNNPADFFTAADLDGDGRKELILLDTVVNKLLIYQNICSPKPYIDNCLPVLGISGDTATLKGANFSQVSDVMLGDQRPQFFKVVNDSTITFVVGNSFTGEIQVTNPFGTGNYNGFTFGRAPVIFGISPVMGPVGTEVTIRGQYFSPVAAENIVNFSGVTATVISATTTSLKVAVPAHTSTGPITVTTHQRVAEYGDFFKVTFPGPKNGFSISTFDMSLRLYGRHGGVLMDMDNDGKQDIITHDNDNLIIYHNNSTPGKMSFGEPLVMAIKGNGQLNTLVDTVFWGPQIGQKTPLSNPAVMDLNGDGKADIVTFNPEDDLLYIYLNNSTTGEFKFRPPYTVSSPGASIISIHDYDGDGKPDILHLVGKSIRVFRNTGSADTFSLAEPTLLLNVNGNYYNVKTIAVNDIDQDGKIDILDGSYLYYNNSIPGKVGIALSSLNISMDKGVMALYDLNNNDKPDLAMVRGENIGQLTTLLYFCKNTVDRNASVYQPDFSVDSYQPVNHWANQITAGDFDGDGLADLLVNHSYLGGNGNLLKNVSTSDSIKFLPFVPTRTGVDGNGWAVAGDLDGDSKPDLVLFGNNEGGTWVARNRYDEVVNLTVCNGADTSITSNNSGEKYQWQVLKTGTDFVDISNDTLYTNVNGKTLQLKRVPASINGYTYRCLVNNNPSEYTGIQVTANTFPSLNLQRISNESTFCPGSPIELSTTAYSGGTAPVFQWWMDDSVRLDSAGTYFKCDTFTVNHSIQAKMISNGVCPDKAIVESNKQDYIVFPIAEPKVILAASSVIACANSDTTRYTFTAFTPNVGPGNGPSFKWYYNGTSVAQEEGPILIKSGLHTGDSIYAILSVASGHCIAGRDYRSNTIELTKGNQAAADGSITARSFSDCPTDPKSIIFTSNTVDVGSQVDFYETDEAGQFSLGGSILFIRDSVVYTPKFVSGNITQRYLCKVTPPQGSCQQAFTSNTISMRWHKWTRPALQLDGVELVAVDNLAGATFRWMNKDLDTLNYPPVSSGTFNRYTPPGEGYYIVEARLGSCYGLSYPFQYGTTGDRQLPVIRPNPVSDVLIMDQIKLTDNWTTLEIRDIYGHIQLPAINVTGQSSVTVNISKLGNGMYLAVLKDIGNRNLAVRFVKMNQ